MIELTMKQHRSGGGYDNVLTLTVADDGTYTMDGDEKIARRIEKGSILDRTAPGGRLFLADDPARWARRARAAFRTGYLVPVITRDDDA